MSSRKGWLMTCISVRCPHCHSEQVVKRGKTHRGTQRYLCQNTACTKGSFLLDYRNRGCVPEVRHTIIDMSLNASGVRDTARVLHISTDTLLKPFGVKRFYTDHWGAYKRHLDPEEHMPGKRHTQNIERKHLTLRTRIKRLVRKTICFSKSQHIHDIIIGLFVNRYAFGRVV